MLTPPYHYFASSAVGWTKHNNLETCLRLQRITDTIDNDAKNCNVYRISGDDSRFYKVDLYKPVIPEHHKEFVATVIY